jgi:hypothetical protein
MDGYAAAYTSFFSDFIKIREKVTVNPMHPICRTSRRCCQQKQQAPARSQSEKYQFVFKGTGDTTFAELMALGIDRYASIIAPHQHLSHNDEEVLCIFTCKIHVSTHKISLPFAIVTSPRYVSIKYIFHFFSFFSCFPIKYVLWRYHERRHGHIQFSRSHPSLGVGSSPSNR